jgi:hypothetical protein
MAATGDLSHDPAKAEKGLDIRNGPPSLDVSVGSGEDILALQDLDAALNRKMHLVNNVSKPFAESFPQDEVGQLRSL